MCPQIIRYMKSIMHASILENKFRMSLLIRKDFLLIILGCVMYIVGVICGLIGNDKVLLLWLTSDPNSVENSDYRF